MKDDGRAIRVKPHFFQGEKWLVYTGLLGLVVGICCAVYIFFTGGIQPPEGDLSKAVSFNLAFGLFVVTTAAIFPFAGFRERKRLILRRVIIVASLYGYGVETIQHLRGIDPRFTQHGGVMDIILGLLFGVVSLVLVVCYTIITIQFFREHILNKRPQLIIGIRYGLVTTMISFIAGLWIIVIQSRYTGLDGNIIWVHGFGFHGLQLMPLIGWFLEKQFAKNHRLLHITGMLWIASITLIGIQTTLGKSIFQVDVIVGIIGIFVLAIAILFVKSALDFYAHFKHNRHSLYS